MADDVWFRSAVRRGGAPVAGAHGRAILEHGFQVTSDQDSADVTMRLATAGVPDVRALRPGAVRRVVPAAGVPNAARDQRPYVEMADVDLPWRYSPGKDPVTGGPLPWLMLLVGTLDELQVDGDSAVAQPALLEAHPLDGVGRWAHVQVDRADAPEGEGVARILCGRIFRPGATQLAFEQDHVAALVVPWTDTGAPAWPASPTSSTELRCLLSWRFRTDEPLTFAELALALHGVDADRLGVMQVVVDDPDSPMEVGGALTTLPDDVPPSGDEVDTTVLEHGTAAGAPIVGPPAYGAAWRGQPDVRERVLTAGTVGESTWSWPEQANADLRRRVVAAVGRQAGVDLQEEIVLASERAWRSGPAVSAVLNGLALGLSAGGELWRRVPADPVEALTLVGPAMGRMRTGPDEPREAPTLRRALASPTEPDRAAYPVGLLGPSGARALRAGGPARRHAATGGADLAAVATAAATPVEVPDRPQRAVETGADVADVDPAHLDTVVIDAREQAGEAATDDALETLGAERDIDPHPAGERVKVRPVDLGAVSEMVCGHLDPRAPLPPARRRVRDRLVGVAPGRELQPLEDCPDLDLPAWRYLRDRAPHWLLPGADTLGDGEVASLRTNPGFVEAFLLGLNQQALAELRWRQHPVRAGCTPLRRFWDRTPQAGAPRDDIGGVAQWADATGSPDGRLGTHSPATVVPERLVVVMRTNLFRRFPRTLVSLAPDGTTVPAALGTRDWPEFVTALADDLTMFAFRVDPGDAAQRWVVVEEVPDGIRFRTDDLGVGTDSAAVAATLLLRPVRALLPGSETLNVGSL